MTRMLAGVSCAAAALWLVAGAACNKPDAPDSGTVSIQGRVKLVARTGVSWLIDPDSIPVYLLQGDAVVDSTRTTGGAFAWSGKSPGVYQVGAGRHPAPWTISHSVTVTSGSIALSVPLLLGDPFPATVTPTAVHCPDSIHVRLLTQGFPGKLRVSIWDLAFRRSVYTDSVTVLNGGIAQWFLSCDAFGGIPGYYWILLDSTVGPLPGYGHWATPASIDVP